MHTHAQVFEIHNTKIAMWHGIGLRLSKGIKRKRHARYTQEGGKVRRGSLLEMPFDR
jgi:hypothetical protein